MPITQKVIIPDADVVVQPLGDTLRKWAVITIDKFQAELVKLDIGELDGMLMLSFAYEVEANGGDAWAVLIKFLKYGRFIDMGVGRGHPLGRPSIVISGNGNRYQNEGTRTAKKWYGKIKTRETAILLFILKKNYSILALKKLEAGLKSLNQES